MEADWEVEIGGDAAIIDANWAGLVDLRQTPDRAATLQEATELTGLASILASLNARSSPVWTSKCDVWRVDAFDPDELDAPPDAALQAIACYIDLVAADPGLWCDSESAVSWCQTVCANLHSRPIRSCRADLVVRRAILVPDRIQASSDLGITAYVTASAATAGDASATLESALSIVASIIVADASPAAADQKLQ